MSGRINQVEFVLFPLHTCWLELNRNTALLLELHRIHHLLTHLTLSDRMRQLQKTVRERTLTVVNVGNDTKITNIALWCMHSVLQKYPYSIMLTTFNQSLELAGFLYSGTLCAGGMVHDQIAHYRPQQALR